uniref:Uncharacterized protein n=1 Tax=Glossina pallidipes TaxID=7398 RepID=A0A1B0AFW7_GLOPL
MSNKRLSLMLSELFEMGFKTVSESHAEIFTGSRPESISFLNPELELDDVEHIDKDDKGLCLSLAKSANSKVISSSKLFPGTIYLTGICDVSFAENGLFLEIGFALSVEIFSIHFAEIVGDVFLRFSVPSLLQSWLKVSTISLPARVSFVTNDLGGDFLVDYSELQCRQRQPVQYRNVL